MITTKHLLASLSCGALLIAGSANAANLTWAGGAGTWQDGTQDQFDAAWSNANPDSADFTGSVGTVTVSGSIDLLNLDFSSASGGYVIDGGTLNFASGGVISNSNNTHNHTITSVITGAPTVSLYDGPAGNGYEGIIFAPTSGSQTLGLVQNPNNTGNRDKSGIYLNGSTTGNTATEILYVGGDRYGTVYKQGTSTWSVGNITTGTLRVSGGTLNINGNVHATYNNVIMTGGRISGNVNFFKSDRRSSYQFTSGALAPGNSIGTIEIDWGTGGGPNASQWTTTIGSGVTYEWEVGAGNTTDIINIQDGRLVIQDFTLQIIDLGGTPAAGDQLAVFTYGTLDSKTLDLANVTIDTSLAPNWDASGASLVDDGSGTIYLTGLVPEPSSLALLGLGGLLIARRRRG